MAEYLGNQKLELWVAFDLVIDHSDSHRSDKDLIDCLQLLLSWSSSDCDSEPIQRSVFPRQVEDHDQVYASVL